MEQAYFLRRELAELKAASSAASTEARLTHFDMAGRYASKAAAAAESQSWGDDTLPRASY